MPSPIDARLRRRRHLGSGSGGRNWPNPTAPPTPTEEGKPVLTSTSSSSSPSPPFLPSHRLPTGRRCRLLTATELVLQKMPFWLATLGLLCSPPCMMIGPDFWGLMHKHWRMCKTGKLQSPINIDPEKLVFDPALGKLTVSKHQLDATLWNTGQFPLLATNASHLAGKSQQQQQEKLETVYSTTKSSIITAAETGIVTISGGPAYPYTYQFDQLLFHFGDIRKGERGSEHTIDRVRYPAEIQLLAFNSDLYENFTHAQSQPRGLLGVGLIVDLGNKTNSELKRLTHAAPSIKHRNQMIRVRNFQPAALFPSTDHYVSYEGSLTFPGCYETVIWVIYNSPIYITAEHLSVWAELVQSEKPPSDKDGEGNAGSGGAKEAAAGAAPPVPLSSNYRPLKANNGRMVRTNINVKLKSTQQQQDGNCPSNVYVDMGYQSNPKRADPPPQHHHQQQHHRQHQKSPPPQRLKNGNSHEQYKYQIGSG